MGSRRHHHLVSRGYQRLFGVGEQIALRRREGGEVKIVGTRSAFARKDFSSYRNEQGMIDELEEEWARLENLVLPRVRALVQGQEHAELRQAVKVLASIHWARSYSFDKALSMIVRESWDQAPAQLASDPEVHAVFLKEFGQTPQPGEIEAIVDERMETEFGPSGAFRIERMANAHNQALGKLEPLHVQLIRPATSRVPFIFSDTPVVHFDKMRVGWRNRLALGDASHIYLPLAPWLGAMFTTKVEEDQVVAPAVIQKLNHLAWRASWEFLAGHPGTDFDRAVP